MKKTYLYARFSSARQAEGTSIDRQIELAEDYAKRRGLDIEDKSIDAGVSAFRSRNRNQGALGNFLQMVDNGQIATPCNLLVESLDRISRDKATNAQTAFLEILNRGITIITIADDKVYSTDMDSMQMMTAVMVLGRANDESAMKSIRTSTAWEKARLKAADSASPAFNARVPDWLRVKDKGVLEPVPEHAETINRIFMLSAGGEGIERIAKQLNADGCTTFKGAQWRSSGISKLLRNRAVIGEFQFHQRNEDGDRVPVGEVIQNYYPQVVERTLFLQVQEGMDNRNKRGSGNRAGQFTNLFTGLLRCGECGDAVVIGSQNKQFGNGYLKCVRRCEDSTSMNYKYTEPQVLMALSCIQKVIEKYRKPITDKTASLGLEKRRLAEVIRDYSELLDSGHSKAIAKRLMDAELKLEQVETELIREQERVLSAQQKEMIVLGNEPISTVEERRAFNVKLRAAIDEIQMVEHPHRKGSALIYYVNEQPVLEQHFTKINGAHGTESEIWELSEDNSPVLVGRTNSKKPLELKPQ